MLKINSLFIKWDPTVENYVYLTMLNVYGKISYTANNVKIVLMIPRFGYHAAIKHFSQKKSKKNVTFRKVVKQPYATTVPPITSKFLLKEACYKFQM